MFNARIRLGWALAVVVVLATALTQVAGAASRVIQPPGPWYAYDAALRQAHHLRQQHDVKSIQPTSPWYAYDAALRKARHQRLHRVEALQNHRIG